MAQKIFIDNFPNEDLQKEMIGELSQMKSENNHSLPDLIGVIYEGIKAARKLKNSWDTIAEFVTQKTGTNISGESLRQAYKSYTYELRNQGKEADELTYAQLRARYQTALQLLKIHNIDESAIDAMMAEKKNKEKRPETSPCDFPQEFGETMQNG